MMSGQSVMDRVIAAKHSIAGSGLAKSVCKATTEEIIGPKKKHLDYLVHCTNEPNVSIPQMADLLIERTQHANWVVVFKSLISIHNLMNYGNERFSQYFASNNCTFNLNSFIDKSGVHGYDMSTFVRRYAKYLNAKSYCYRTMAYDFCKVKRGKEDGLLRTMSAEKLLKTIPPLQTQLDCLLEFECTANELTNGVMNACFMLLFKDLIRLFACYNDGIINLLEKYFDMNKKQCKDGLEMYKKFLVRMDKVSEFLKVAENVGIDKGDIPDLAKAPSSLLQALEEHYEYLENKKGSAPVKPTGFTSALNSMSSANIPVSDEEKSQILQEEIKQFEEFKKKKDEYTPVSSTNPFLTSPVAVETKPPAVDLFGSPSSPQGLSNGLAPKASDDLLSLNTNPFQQNIENIIAQTNQTQVYSDPSMGMFGPSAQSPWSSSTHDSAPKPPPGFDSFGDLLKPLSKSTPTKKEPNKLIDGDLDTSMMQLAGSLTIKGSEQIKKTEHQWQPRGDQKLTGGTNWQHQVLTTGSTWSAPAAYTQQPQQMMGIQRMPYATGVPAQPPYMGMNQNMGSVPNTMGQIGAYNQPMMMSGYGTRMPQQTQANDPFGAL